MKLTQTQRDSLLLGAIGAVVALGYGLGPIDFGGETLPRSDAWARWVAQPYVAAGVLLIVMAISHSKGATWPRWPIILWCPVTIIGGMLWALSRGVGHFNLGEFVLLGAPILLIWLWATYRMFFTRSSPT